VEKRGVEAMMNFYNRAARTSGAALHWARFLFSSRVFQLASPRRWFRSDLLDLYIIVGFLSLVTGYLAWEAFR